MANFEEKPDFSNFEFDFDGQNFEPEAEESNTVSLSEEQLAIIRALDEGNNVIVDAVAGSGKTTLVLGLAKRLNKQILQITYNAALKEEVRQKSKNLDNLEVHSYHSLAVKFYSSIAYTDQNLSAVVEKDMKLKRKADFEIIVIDEAQDMMPLYYQLIKKFIRDTNDCQLLVMGDHHQAIYTFKGADARFLTHADKIWGDKPFIFLTLNISYRLTNEIADFVSLATKRKINTVRGGVKVKYIHGSDRPFIKSEMDKKAYYGAFEDEKSHFATAIIICQVLELLKTYKPEDIFILMPSIKNGTHISREVENHLVKRGIPCYAPDFENAQKTTDLVMNNKIVFTTLNMSKGRERKCVFVYHFDNSYYDYYNQKCDDTTICPNVHYVAMTRASEQLFLIHIAKHSVISYVDKTMFGELEFIPSVPTKFEVKIAKNAIFNETTPSELKSYLKDKYLAPLSDLLEHKSTPVLNDITIPSIVQFGENHEELECLIGIAVPSTWEYKKKRMSTILNSINRARQDAKQQIYMPRRLQQFIEIANEYHSMCTGFQFKLKQVTDYEWFTDSMIDECHELLNKVVVNVEKFEEEVIILVDWRSPENENYNILVKGRLDGLNSDCIWEFKCTSHLKNDDLIQLIIYAFMWENNHYLRDGKLYRKRNENGKLYDHNGACKPVNIFESKRVTNYQYRLFNCKTGETWTLIYDDDKINEIVNILFENRFYAATCTDEMFIDLCVKPFEPKDPLLSLSMVELKAKCKELGLKPSGKSRAALIELIKAPIVEKSPEELLRAETNTELIAKCKARGIKIKSGLKKDDLIKLLLP